MNLKRKSSNAPHPVRLKPFKAMRTEASFRVVEPPFKSAIRSDKGILTKSEKWQRQVRY